MLSRGILSYRPPALGLSHMVSSGNHFASLAGYEILNMGGNAVDAGVASGLAINVTQPHRTSIAGVAPILLYIKNENRVVSISGLGRWPRGADREHFVKTFGKIPDGMARCVVPAAFDAWVTALERFGTMSFEQVVGPALNLARRGFPISRELHASINDGKLQVHRWPYDGEVFSNGGRLLKYPEPLVQKDLARVLTNMIEVEQSATIKGRAGAIRAVRDYFYKGEIAEKMVDLSDKEGGFLTLQDMADFSVTIEEPEKGTYNGHTLYSSGFWCQGPTLINVMNILENFDLKGLGHNSADYIHALIEAFKLAYSDRHYFFGDPDFIDVPGVGLLSKRYALERKDLFNWRKAWPEMPPMGDPWEHQAGNGRTDVSVPREKKGTTEPDTSYTCVVDKWGNAFSATPSDGIGPTPMVPGLGMIVSGRGTQTWLDRDHPSRLEPWKRPRLTPNPAMVFKNGKLSMPFGTPGGDMQVQGMVQMFLNMVEFDMDPQQAVEEPRVGSWSHPDSFWPHKYEPGLLELEGRITQDVAGELVNRGHKLRWLSEWGYRASGLCGIFLDEESGVLIGGADPRADSHAVGI